MKAKKLGICVVGCGQLGTVHATRWLEVPEARVIAVVDLIEERAIKLANTCNLDTWYTDYREAVALPDVDVVSVCIPTFEHAKVSIYAAENGKHVMSEKPMALTLDQADGMITSAEKNNVKLTLGFMRRHMSVLDELRDYLSGGRLGRPVMYHASDIREIRPKIEMHDDEVNGGPVIDMAVHLVDLWSHIFDSHAVSVFCQGLTMAAGRPEIGNPKKAAPDTATIVVTFASGDIGTFVVTWGLPPGVSPDELPDQVYGPKGLAQINYGWSKQDLRVMQEGGEWVTVAEFEEDPFLNEMQSFANAILRDEPLKVSAQEGRDVLRVVLAARESLATGKVVDI
jgi:predicted dehydrogenase